MPWFRFFRRRSDTAPVEAAAPAATEHVEVDDRPADTAGDQQHEKPRRRRGSRGGRGRRKPSERRTEAKAEPEPAPAVTFNGEIAVGTALPDTVKIVEVPKFQKYGFAFINKKRIIVEQPTRKIIAIY